MVLQHAVNIRHGADGFISLPKEIVLRIFIAIKNPSPLNARIAGPMISTLQADHRIPHSFKFDI
jgi:hypothetical protein